MIGKVKFPEVYDHWGAFSLFISNDRWRVILSLWNTWLYDPCTEETKNHFFICRYADDGGVISVYEWKNTWKLFYSIVHYLHFHFSRWGETLDNATYEYYERLVISMANLSYSNLQDIVKYSKDESLSELNLKELVTEVWNFIDRRRF